MSIKIPFEFIHLSSADEKFVTDFLNIMRKSRDQPMLYEKYLWGLDVLCADFGPQIFLQRTELFNHILVDLYSNPAHYHFTVTSVLPTLLKYWTQSFR